MKKTTYVASKDLQIDGFTYKAGTPLATVETAIPLDRLANGVSLGHAIDKNDYDKSVAEMQQAELADAQKKVAEIQQKQKPPAK